MRYVSFGLVLAMTVSACGPSLTPEQKQERAENRARTEIALQNATTATVNGQQFRVAVIPNRTYALVDLVSTPSKYAPSDVVTAAQRATGCKGEFAAGILAFVGGEVNTFDLNEFRKKVSGNFNGWRVNLSC